MATNVSTINPNLTFSNSVSGLTISWDDLSYIENFKRYRLIRKTYDYAMTAVDGEIIFDGVGTSVFDATARNGRSYYYSLYVVIDRTVSGETFEDYLISNRFKSLVIVHSLGESADKMYRALPQLYRTSDDKAQAMYNQAEPLPLYRFMCLLGYQFDKIENLLALVLDNIDIDTCADKFLPYIAKWLGVEYDWSISVTDNRTFIKMMIENYSRKGTFNGLKTLIQSISKTRVEIIVNKELTPSDASPTAISLRRTVQVEIYLDADSDSWVGSRQEKVLKVVSQNVPKKNAYTVRIVVLFDFWDTYTKLVKEKRSLDEIVENTSDQGRRVVEGADTMTLVDSSDDVFSKEIADAFEILMVIYKTISEPYGKTVSDGFRTITYLSSNYDDKAGLAVDHEYVDNLSYVDESESMPKSSDLLLDTFEVRTMYDDKVTVGRTDDKFDTISFVVAHEVYDKVMADAIQSESFNHGVEKYARKGYIDYDVSGVRGVSLRAKNLRGKLPNATDVITRAGVVIDVRTY